MLQGILKIQFRRVKRVHRSKCRFKDNIPEYIVAYIYNYHSVNTMRQFCREEKTNNTWDNKDNKNTG